MNLKWYTLINIMQSLQNYEKILSIERYEKFDHDTIINNWQTNWDGKMTFLRVKLKVWNVQND